MSNDILKWVTACVAYTKRTIMFNHINEEIQWHSDVLLWFLQACGPLVGSITAHQYKVILTDHMYPMTKRSWWKRSLWRHELWKLYCGENKSLMYCTWALTSPRTWAGRTALTHGLRSYYNVYTTSAGWKKNVGFLLALWQVSNASVLFTEHHDKQHYCLV